MSKGGKRAGAGRPKGRESEKVVVKGFSLMPGTARRLEALAEETKRPMSQIVDAALRAYFKEAEAG